MDKEYIRRRLPEEPPKGMLRWALGNCRGELGGDYMIYRNERIREPVPLEEVMENVTVGKKIWAANCTCTTCQEDFYTDTIPGGRGFRMLEGEDGNLYNWPGELAEPGTVVEVAEGDFIICPNCFEKVRVVAARSIRGGRTKRIKVCTLQNVEGYTAIVYYLVRRTLHEDGWVDSDVEPDRAVVITEHFGRVYYTHRENGCMGLDKPGRMWAETKSKRDPSDLMYADWGSIRNKKVGAVVYKKQLPDMDGTTGEKTGLRAWFENAGAYPIEYFKIWKKHKNIEALVLAGGVSLLEDVIIDSSYGCESALDAFFDLSRKKPHQMLGLSKQTMKQMVRTGCLRKGPIENWRRYCRLGGKMTDEAFFRLQEKTGLQAMETAIELMEQYHDDVQKIFSYIHKQGLSRTEVGLLRDARRFARELGGGDLTGEQLWPRHLREAHDRLAQQRRLMVSKEEAAKYQKGFEEVLRKYGDIQWNDGVLAVILPKDNSELVREGDVLRHCVGGYGGSHSRGKSIIFFIRHYRRPERSYYTLNIRFGEGEPKEVQLHGYGNERHGPNKEYTHKIPRKVRDFVDRWESEVLLPWWREQNKQKKERKTA